MTEGGHAGMTMTTRTKTRTLAASAARRMAVKAHMPEVGARARTLATGAKAASRPVWLFVAAEVVVVGALLGLAAIWAVRLVSTMDPIAGAPWQALVVFPLLGAGGRALRLWRPGVTMHRWHGVLVRRIDRRWAGQR